jgi:hypothetical protein
MGTHWPGHSPPRETTGRSPGVSPVPSERGVEPKGIGRPNPMVGFLRAHAGEEVTVRVRLDDPDLFLTEELAVRVVGIPGDRVDRPAVGVEVCEDDSAAEVWL